MPVTVDVEKCDGCKSCVDVCPTDSMKVPEAVAVTNPDDCIDCNACIDNCPSRAIALAE
jgi:NAD-dependent dihydropyrimidine dehydrogenase PreA subunit